MNHAVFHQKIGAEKLNEIFGKLSEIAKDMQGPMMCSKVTRILGAAMAITGFILFSALPASSGTDMDSFFLGIGLGMGFFAGGIILLSVPHCVTANARVKVSKSLSKYCMSLDGKFHDLEFRAIDNGWHVQVNVTNANGRTMGGFGGLQMMMQQTMNNQNQMATATAVPVANTTSMPVVVNTTDVPIAVGTTSVEPSAPNGLEKMELGQTTTSIPDKLKQLSQLHQDGVLTEAEFEKAKDRVLNGSS